MGKTSIIEQFINKKIPTQLLPTYGGVFKQKKVVVDSKQIVLDIVDVGVAKDLRAFAASTV